MKYEIIHFSFVENNHMEDRKEFIREWFYAKENQYHAQST